MQPITLTIEMQKVVLDDLRYLIVFHKTLSIASILVFGDVVTQLLCFGVIRIGGFRYSQFFFPLLYYMRWDGVVKAIGDKL